MECKSCGARLSNDEKAIFKRLVDRGAPDEECVCKSCLAELLGVTVDAIDKKIEHFKSIGCTLFN